MKKLQPLVDENGNKLSVWDLKQFPSNTKPYQFTPQQVKDALIEYSETSPELQTVIEKHNIRFTSFFDIVDQHPEIREAYMQARKRKAYIMVGEAKELYGEEIPAFCYESGKDGQKRISMAGIRWIENKHNSRLRIAEIHETGQISQKTTIEQRTLQVNVNVDIPAPSDIVGMKPEDMLSSIDDLLSNG